MEKERISQIKRELEDYLENYDLNRFNSPDSTESLSEDSAKDLLDLLNNMSADAEVSRDTTPMIGTNPFKNSNKSDTEVSNKDINQSLNYRVQKFNDFE